MRGARLFLLLAALSPGSGALAKSLDTFTEALCGTTQRAFSEDIGTQIEYLAPDGRAYLIFPGVKTVIEGGWATQTNTSGGIEICFRYDFDFGAGPGSSDLWECMGEGDYTGALREILPGDPLDLARGGTLGASLPTGQDVSITDFARSAQKRLTSRTKPDRACQSGGLPL